METQFWNHRQRLVIYYSWGLANFPSKSSSEPKKVFVRSKMIDGPIRTLSGLEHNQ